MPILRKLGFVVGLGMGLFHALPAFATLGEPYSSIEKDRKALLAQSPKLRPSSPGAHFKVHEIKSDSATVREFTNEDGIVFAVAWNGIAHPELPPLLGRYEDDFQKASHQKRKVKGQRNQKIAGSQVVVEKWGRMRDLHGRAYVPELLPPGVKPNEIQ